MIGEGGEAREKGANVWGGGMKLCGLFGAIFGMCMCERKLQIVTEERGLRYEVRIAFV